MNLTNRLANRLLLFVAGMFLLAMGVVALAAGMLLGGQAPGWLQQRASAVPAAVEAAAGWTWQIPGVGSVSALLLLTAATAVLLIVALIAFLATRRRGRSKAVLEVDVAGGRTTVDRNVAEEVLTAPLIRRHDVLSARTAAYRVGRRHAVALAITVRPGAPLGVIIAATEKAVREWDELLGARIPILVHLSDRRWRDAFRSPTRVQ
ncbi:hypothetical protein [Microbacterium paraoxydans]|uniref:hypothetical protein n=1 Tax=Microbacterium paraoxydans TaxID=199592 RepID=UPI001CF9FACC|nr:hypothetical protein [Microbacterium paraoxydans]